MKIKVNYDLLEKIQEAKHGFVLQKNVRRVSGMITAVIATQALIEGPFYNVNQILSDLAFLLPLNVWFRLPDILITKLKQSESIEELKNLADTLRSINISTDYELLLEAYKYETNYQFEFEEDKFPSLKQNKFIMVPINDEGKEVSLMQEYIIGSNEYTLSCGSPQKELKLSFNPVQ